MDRARVAKEVKLRAPVRGLTSGAYRAEAELVHYVVAVRRWKLGAPFVAFDPERGVEADVSLEEAGDGYELHVGALRPATVVASRPLVLVQGLAKGDKCDAIVRDATELGATRVVLVATERSVVRPAEAKLSAKVERWQRIADEAARQCGRGDTAVVVTRPSLTAALDDATDGTAAFVLWENATAPLGPPLSQAVRDARPLLFVVGPEGGLTEAEVEACRARGSTVASLGPFVLRTETVAAAVLGAVRVLDLID